MDIYRPLSQRKECRPYSWVDINLKKVQSNYIQWKTLVEPSICSAVLKANAYGLGAIPVGQALLAAGCRHFFVAYLDEAIAFYEGLKELGRHLRPFQTPHIIAFLSSTDPLLRKLMMSLNTTVLSLYSTRWRMLSSLTLTQNSTVKSFPLLCTLTQDCVVWGYLRKM